jgi:integrase
LSGDRHPQERRDARQAKGLVSAGDDRGRLSKWVLPELDADAKTPIKAIQKLDIERLVERTDERVIAGDLEWTTAMKVWGVVTKLFDDATNAKKLALRVIERNPAHGVRGPDRGAKKSKVYVFPSEFLLLTTCPLIPVRWRRLYTLAIYLYVRASELRGVEWADVDLEHGVVFIHRTLADDGNLDTTKGEVPRRFKIEPELMPLLRAMHKESGGVGRVFDPFPMEKHLAPMIRRDLKRAGVTRAELFAHDKTRKQMTFHDLRSTGITWMAVRGDDPLKIKHRAGHKQFSTSEGYIREAEAVRDGFGAPFPALPEAIVSSGISSERLGLNGHVYKIKGESRVGEAGFEPATTSTQSSCTTGLCDSPEEPKASTGPLERLPRPDGSGDRAYRAPRSAANARGRPRGLARRAT